MKQKEIVIPILNSEYKVIVCWGDEKFLKKVMKSWYYPDFPIPLGERRGSTYHRSDCHPVIYLPRKPKTKEEIGTLAHEAVHAVNHIFDMIEDDNRSTEVFAHSVGAVVKGALK
jgi:hypothetical protein